MKNLLQKKKASGFTIIEVIIVLAIAGLIMVIVFIAVPQLQRNQRDNARQNIVNRVTAEMDTYAGNNQGKLPLHSGAGCSATTTGCWENFFANYINGKINVTDPTTGTGVVVAAPAGGFKIDLFGAAGLTLPAHAGDFSIVAGSKCSGENIVASGTASLDTRNYAVLIGLDRDGTRYCVDNG
jgi:prepilin-type N-terminal cleavage/methylation domain-containing protein